MNRIEAVLFASPRPIERPTLARIVGHDASIDLLIDDIRAELRGKPYELVSVAGGWQLRTRPAYGDAINASMALPDRHLDFTRTELMVLASIAYHQPITRAGVSDIIGHDASRDVIAALRDKNMITAGPRSRVPQRQPRVHNATILVGRICHPASLDRKSYQCSLPKSICHRRSIGATDPV
jgi:chromosome segregation and condensation protein ScpB